MCMIKNSHMCRRRTPTPLKDKTLQEEEDPEEACYTIAFSTKIYFNQYLCEYLLFIKSRFRIFPKNMVDNKYYLSMISPFV